MEKIPKEAALVKGLQSIKREIKHYPTPITGCDEQFNFLLSERDRLTEELNNSRYCGLRVGLKTQQTE